MEPSDVIAGLALIISCGALWFTWRADKRASEKDGRDEVHFVAELSDETDDEYRFRIINKGTKTAINPYVDAESIRRFAATFFTAWASGRPNEPLSFHYQKPRTGQLESITLRWEGPGLGEQSVAIPPHRKGA